ncbi:MAG TPA: serine hydrolase domain-containing protein [Thermoanaerobaculia bacterium]|nr:serine hydrolase domain-containing protein [Thermoanaerobaculia bacterium]
MTRAVLALLLVLGHVPVAEAARRRAVQTPPPEVAPAAVVTAATEAAQSMMAAGVPAVQIAVSKRGRILYADAFGVLDKDNNTAATPRSMLQIASITKEFTGAAILRLAERGALSLDDPIDKYVPEFNSRGVTITLRHLLTHTSGISRDWYPPTPNGFAPSGPVTRAQTMASLNQKPFEFSPGKKWSYSDAGYILLGYAIESITGISYAEYIHTEIVLPLGLVDTGVCGTFNVSSLPGYGLLGGAWKKMPPPHWSVMLSNGALCSTASDLVRWAHLLANGAVLAPASYEAMTTPARLDDGSVVSSGYALGVAVANMLGRPAVWHSGAIDGFQSYLVYFPDEDLAVAVIINAFPVGPGGNPQTIAMAVANAALTPQQ